jgi:pteridine reductase
MEQSLDGKVVLITGGGVRVGRAIVEAVAAKGAHVAVHCHSSRKEADALASRLSAQGRTARVFQADLSAEAQIEPLVAQVESALGPIAALVNSAARFDRAPFLGDDNPLDKVWALNGRAPYLLSRAVAKRMVGRGGGDIVNIVDIGGVYQAWKQYAAYCMSKAALGALTKCLALELAPSIRVNAVAPGTVLPPEGMPAETLEILRSRIPQKQFGAPEDVAAAVLFFLTGPRFVTGQILSVDGGRLLASTSLD